MDNYQREKRGTSVESTLLSIMMAQTDHLLFRTAGGRLGLANGTFTVGDQLVLFDGARIPYLVRKCNEKSGESYQLTGIANVRGVMYGEIDSLGLESQDIILV